MSFITERNALRSLDEKKEAIKKMFSLFPEAKFEPDSNSFNNRKYSSFKVNIPFERFIPVAQKFIIHQDELFDFTIPKIIEPGRRMWKDFVYVTLFWHAKYNFYTTGDSIQQSISLSSCSYFQGLKHWKTQFSKLRDLLNKNPDKVLVKSYKAEIDEINENVLEWEKAIHKASKINLNGK